MSWIASFAANFFSCFSCSKHTSNVLEDMYSIQMHVNIHKHGNVYAKDIYYKFLQIYIDNSAIFCTMHMTEYTLSQPPNRYITSYLSGEKVITLLIQIDMVLFSNDEVIIPLPGSLTNPTEQNILKKEKQTPLNQQELLHQQNLEQLIPHLKKRNRRSKKGFRLVSLEKLCE